MDPLDVPSPFLVRICRRCCLAKNNFHWIFTTEIIFNLHKCRSLFTLLVFAVGLLFGFCRLHSTYRNESGRQMKASPARSSPFSDPNCGWNTQKIKTSCKIKLACKNILWFIHKAKAYIVSTLKKSVVLQYSKKIFFTLVENIFFVHMAFFQMMFKCTSPSSWQLQSCDT